MKIDIINYNVNNIAAVAKLFKNTNFKVNFVKKPSDLDSHSNLTILPGVGNWKAGLNSLTESGMYEALLEINNRDRKILGICLGFQLLSSVSEEADGAGLSIIDAEVKSIRTLWGNGKLVNSGWCECKDNLDSMPKKYYFTHSYCFDKNDLEINDSTDYVSWIAGTNIVAAYRTKNIFGIQFHPEKSHDQGNEFVNKMLIEWV